MNGYFRFPTIHKNKIVFISEDDLWIIDTKNPVARRITTNIANVSSPLISADGLSIAYVGQEDGNTEIYTMPINGGLSTRLTHEGGHISNIAFSDDNNIYYSSSIDSPFAREYDLRMVSINGGMSKPLNYGMIRNISIYKKNIVLGKNTADSAKWKRYKGGTAGKLLININGSNSNFKYLLNLNGNISSPMYIKARIYFISDHEGIANIYSCKNNGKDLLKHTEHKNYYVRNASFDNNHIVYQCGGRIFTYDLNLSISKHIKIIYHSSKNNVCRKFSSTSDYLERYSLNNTANYINVISRGKAFTMGNWDGPVLQHGMIDGVRYNHPCTLKNNKSLLLTSDYNNKDNLEIHSLENKKMIKRLKSTCGRILSMKKSPHDDSCLIINYKHELLLLDVKNDKISKVDRSENSPLSANWSPCGKFITYSCSNNRKCRIIKIYDLKKKKIHTITKSISSDSSPVFSPDGKYLAFLSNRTFKPIYDSIQFDLGFPKSDKPYIVILSKDTESPFIKNPKSISNDKTQKKNKKSNKKITTKIDFKNIEDRIIGLPVNESSLDNNIGFTKDKIFYMSWPISSYNYDQSNLNKGTLKFFDLNILEEKIFTSNITGFKIINNKIMIEDYNQLRLISADTIPTKDIFQNNKANKSTGLINLDRIKIEINPISEWKQMFSEAWRLQRDHFWTKDMSNIKWKKVYDRYYKIIDDLGSRSEFSDLIWEMQGELGTSHCYEMGGDYKSTRKYLDGNLGATFTFDSKIKMYKIIKILKGDLWINPQSPLMLAGTNIKEGEYIKAINGNILSKKTTPGKILVNLNNSIVELTIYNKSTKKSRKVNIKTITNDKFLKYRDWVEKNREYVHKKSNEKIGYIHIPDMGVHGFAEFHRYFLTEISYDGLIIDVRYNGGGHISQLLLSKLARKRVGFDLTRWMGHDPYPAESPAGPMVAITNEFAGSDGDIFSHSWKLFKLGKLIGKRTWGGVIGIWPRNSLVDGTLTSQPEFSFWFKDVGWNVENYGTDVDIEIDNMPQDNMKFLDRQLNKGIDIIAKDLKNKNSILKPDFNNKPDLKLP